MHRVLRFVKLLNRLGNVSLNVSKSFFTEYEQRPFVMYSLHNVYPVYTVVIGAFDFVWITKYGLSVLYASFNKSPSVCSSIKRINLGKTVMMCE